MQIVVSTIKMSNGLETSLDMTIRDMNLSHRTFQTLLFKSRNCSSHGLTSLPPPQPRGAATLYVDALGKKTMRFRDLFNTIPLPPFHGPRSRPSSRYPFHTIFKGGLRTGAGDWGRGHGMSRAGVVVIFGFRYLTAASRFLCTTSTVSRLHEGLRPVQIQRIIFYHFINYEDVHSSTQ